MTGNQASATTLAPAADEGFRVRLERTQLSDLIQLQCSMPGRSKVELRANNTLGRLFFDGGRVVHATFGTLAGLDAVVQMLRLRSGRVYPASCGWPVSESLAHGPEQLLLQAAQRLDESSHQPAAPRTEPITGVVPTVKALSHQTGGAVREPRVSVARGPVDGHAVGKALGRLVHAEQVHLSANGTTQQSCGSASPALSDLTYFAQEAADQVGARLGLGPCRALAAFGEDHSFVAFRGDALTGVRAPTEATVALARALEVE